MNSNFIGRIINSFIDQLLFRDEDKKGCYRIAIFCFTIILIVNYFTPFPKYDELQDTKGKVIQISSKKTEYSTIVSIELDTSDGLKKLVTNLCRRVRDVQEGNLIEAKIYKDNLGRNFYWIWELNTNGETVLSYNQVFRYNKWDLDAASFAIGLIVIIYGVVGFLKKK